MLAGNPLNSDSGGHSGTSPLAGGQFGFNYQRGNWVAGIEFDLSFANLKGSNVDPSFPAEIGHTQTNVMGTAAGRFGYAHQRALWFVKGGAAGAYDKYRTTETGTGAPLTQASDTRWGWTVGGGAEYALTRHWSVKAEYNYLDFGKKRIMFASLDAVNPNASPFEEDIRQRIHAVKLGLNYQFDWGKGR